MKFFKMAQFEDEGYSPEEQVEEMDMHKDKQEMDDLEMGKGSDIHTAEILDEAGKNIGERINSSYISTGSVGWFRYKDGVIYEVQVSPLGKGNHLSLFHELKGIQSKTENPIGEEKFPM